MNFYWLDAASGGKQPVVYLLFWYAKCSDALQLSIFFKNNSDVYNLHWIIRNYDFLNFSSSSRLKINLINMNGETFHISGGAASIILRISIYLSI